MKSILFLIVALYCVGYVAAQQPRTIDFTQQIMNLDGKPFMADATHPLTLSDVAVNSLTNTFSQTDTIPGAKKFELYELARKVHNCKQCSLTTDEIATLKDRIALAYGPAVVGPAFLILDPNMGSSISK